MAGQSTHALYAQVMGRKFRDATDYLRESVETEDPSTINLVTMCHFSLAGAARHISLIEAVMPFRTDAIERNVLASEALAFFIRAVQITTLYRHKRDRPDGLFEAYLSLGSVPRTLTRFVETYTSASWSSLWWGRWLEYVKITDLKVLFDQYIYLLITSRGHSAPAIRYDPSPPVLLDFFGTADDPTAMLEPSLFEIACLEDLGQILDALVELAPLLPDEDDLEEDADTEDSPGENHLRAEESKPGLSAIRTVERAAEIAGQCDKPMEEVRRLIDLALKAEFFASDNEQSRRRSAELKESLELLAECRSLPQFLDLYRARLASNNH